MPTPINISASRGAAILGLSKWSTPTKVWLQIMEARKPGFCEKNNYEFPVFVDSAQIRWGKAFESAIIDLASKKQNSEIVKREKLCSLGGFNPFITCHIDGEYDPFSANKILHEGKTTSIFYYRDNFGEPGTDKIPVEYQIQCQHQMICTGAEKVILSVLVFPRRVDDWDAMGWRTHFDGTEYILIDNKKTVMANIVIEHPENWAHTLDQMGYFHQYEIHANPELQALMISNYKKFWKNNILKKNPPQPKNYDDIRALVRNPIGTIIADEHMERVVSEYKNIKSEIGDSGTLAKRIDQIKVDILKFMESASSVVDDDTKDKWILRDRAGNKIASYGKNKKGNMVFR